LSAIVVIIGLVIRSRLDETPLFLEEQDRKAVPRLPLAVLFRDYTPDVLRVVLCALVSTVSTIFGVYTLSYAVNVVKIDRPTMLWVAILTNVIALFIIPLWAMLADRIGRRPVFIFGCIAPGLLMFGYLWAVTGANIPLIFLLAVLMSAITYSASNAVWPAFYAEMFDTRVRLSGMAIGTQIGFALGGFAPSVAAMLQGTGPTGWLPVAGLTLAACVIAAGAALTARETHKTESHALGRPGA
jgi:MFS family permease